MTNQISLTMDLVSLWTTTVRCRAERHRTVCTMWPDFSSISFIVWCRAIGQRDRIQLALPCVLCLWDRAQVIRPLAWRNAWLEISLSLHSLHFYTRGSRIPGFQVFHALTLRSELGSRSCVWVWVITTVGQDRAGQTWGKHYRKKLSV